MTPTVATLLARGAAVLGEHGVPNARKNSEWMLSQVLEFSYTDLLLRSEDVVEDTAATKFWSYVQRRSRREPLQHILGNTEFMSLPLAVRPGVFVPRPDTETLVERVEAFLSDNPTRPRIGLDLCTGSGAIAVALAARNPGLHVTAVDVNPAAVDLTRQNAAINTVDNGVVAVESDALTFLQNSDVLFDVITCNPPYIASDEIPSLPIEVREHDPRAALDGGASGLVFYEALAPLARKALHPGGMVAFEIGDTQGQAVSSILERAGFAGVKVIKDYGARDRVVTAVLD